MKLTTAEDETFLLPMTVVVETGNHIGQVLDGNLRCSCAGKFINVVRRILAGNSPFAPLHFWDADKMRRLLDDFPDSAAQGMGLGDLAIIDDWNLVCVQNQGRRVSIWPLDEHLSSYDHPPDVEQRTLPAWRGREHLETALRIR